MPIQQREIDMRSGHKARLAQTKRIGSGGGRAVDQECGRPHGRQQHRRSLVANGNSHWRGMDGRKLLRAGEQLLSSLPGCFQAQENFFSMSVKCRRRCTGDARKNQKTRKGDHRNLRCFGQPFDGAEANPDPGKTAWPIHGNDSAKIL